MCPVYAQARCTGLVSGALLGSRTEALWCDDATTRDNTARDPLDGSLSSM